MTWWYRDEFETFYPRLGGMHLIMSFVGSIGTLMAETGLKEILESSFNGVPNMLRGKNYPANMVALRMTVEEVLRDLLICDKVDSYEALIQILDERSSKSRTTKLWVDCLVKPTFIMMLFVRADRTRR